MSRLVARAGLPLAVLLASLAGSAIAAAQAPPPPPPGQPPPQPQPPQPPPQPPPPPSAGGAPATPPAASGSPESAPPPAAPPGPPPSSAAPPPPPPPPAGAGWGAAPASGGWAPAAQPPPLWYPPPPPPAEERRGSAAATEDLVPLTHRGGISLESSVFKSAEERLAGGSLVIEGRARLSTHVYLDARLPLAMQVGVDVGNPTIEVRGVAPLGGGRHFIVAGGGLGFPILDDDTQFDQPLVPAVLTNAMWDLHEFSPWTVPLIFRFGTEHHLGRVAIVRTALDPIVNIPYGENETPELQIQHAVELQLGQRIGGGLRLQGVAMPTWEDVENDLDDLEDDLYQLAMEPFFSLEGEQFGTRLGLMLPMDELAGPPFGTAWGARFMFGARLD